MKRLATPLSPLKALNSAGKSAGEEGLHYLSREVINAALDYGAGMLTDMDAETAKTLNKYQEQIGSWRALLWKVLVKVKNYFAEILE